MALTRRINLPIIRVVKFYVDATCINRIRPQVVVIQIGQKSQQGIVVLKTDTNNKICIYFPASAQLWYEMILRSQYCRWSIQN